MGYYVRIFGTRDPDIKINALIGCLTHDQLTANFHVESHGSLDSWSALRVTSSADEHLIYIERNPVIDGQIGKEELEEFREDIKPCKPETAVKWLDKFFNSVRVIYAFHLLSASTADNNYPIVNTVRTAIWKKTGDILQADNEGFSNKDGYHILWQFPDSVTGEWNCAVRGLLNPWKNFRMDLGDRKQREEFRAGKVPTGAIKL